MPSRFVIRVPTSDPKVQLEARVQADNWKAALAAVLAELGRGPDVLDRAHTHIRRDGRIVVEDPDTLRLFELRDDDAPVVADPAPARAAADVAVAPPQTPNPELMRSQARPVEPTGEVAVVDPAAAGRVASPRQPATELLEAVVNSAPSPPPEPYPPSVIVNLRDPEEVPAGFTAEPIPVVTVGANAPRPQSTDRFGAGDPDDDEPGDAVATDAPVVLVSGSGAAAPSPLDRLDQATVVIPESRARNRGGRMPTRRRSYSDLRRANSLEVAAGTLLRAVRARVQADVGVVLIPDARRRYVVIAAGFGLSSDFRVRRFRFGAGVGGFVCEFDSPIRVDDIDLRPDLLGEFEASFDALAAVMAAPVRSSVESFGAVELVRTSGAAFTDQDYELLQELCSEQARRIG